MTGNDVAIKLSGLVYNMPREEAEKTIRSIEGITTVITYPEKKVAIIFFNPERTNEDNIITTLFESGFTVKKYSSMTLRY